MTRLNREQCTCDEGFTSRGRTDPQCRACSTDVNAAIDEVERLSRICDEQVASIDALELENRRIRRYLRCVIEEAGFGGFGGFGAPEEIKKKWLLMRSRAESRGCQSALNDADQEMGR